MLQQKQRGDIKKEAKFLVRNKIHSFIASKSRNLRPYLMHRMRQSEMKLKFLLEEALYLNMIGKCFYTLTSIIFDLVE